MAHEEQTRREARKKYVYERQALPTIAIALGAGEGTVRRWKREARERGDDWDVARAAVTVAGGGLEAVVAGVIEDFVVLYQATLDGVKNAPAIEPAEKVKLLSTLADAFAKTIAAAGRVSPKISELGVAMDVLRRLGEFVRAHHPASGGALLEVLEPFGTHLSEVYR